MKIFEQYTDPMVPGSFSGVTGFLKNNKNLNKKKVKEVLQKEPTVTLHKPIRKKVKRSPFIAYGSNDCFQIDLIDLKSLKYQNSHFQYVFMCIDIFNKFAWGIPIKNKTAEESKRAMIEILKDGRKPRSIMVDEGLEFHGVFKKYLEQQNIKLYFNVSVIKAGTVERLNRTIKERLWRVFTLRKNKRYVDILPKIIYSYNRSFHRSIKRTPISVNESNEANVFKTLYGYDRKTGPDVAIHFIFKLGDLVRTSLQKNIFEKGFTPNFSSEIYLVHEQIPRVPPAYVVKTFEGRKVRGVFYSEQLQKVSQQEFPYDVYEVKPVNKQQLVVKQLNNNSEGYNTRSKTKLVQKDSFLK